MVQRAKIARTRIVQCVLFFWSWLLAAMPAMAASYWVETEAGETAFIVDSQTPEILWIKDTCFEVFAVKEIVNTDESVSVLSEKFSRDVQIGSHRFDLEQQFQFDMADPDPSLQVFNSARGGWSSVDISDIRTCDTEPLCRQRAELSLCDD